MDIARIAFTVLITIPIFILILFLLTKLVSQLGKGSPKSGSPRHSNNINSFKESVDSRGERKRESRYAMTKSKHEKVGRDSKSER